MKSSLSRLTTLAAVGFAATTVVLAQQARAPQTPPASFNLQDTIPLDSAIRTTTLPNGLKVYIRHNEVPAKRVSLRLAVKAGTIDEADDQLGLGHLIQHMAFHASATF